MKQVSLALIAFLLLASSSPVFAQNVDEAWKKLAEATKREIDTPLSEESGRTDDKVNSRKRAIDSRVRRAMDSSSTTTERPEQLLEQVEEAFTSNEVKREATSVRTAVRKEREAKDAALLVRFEDLNKRAAETLRTAKEPRELDALLKEFGQAAQTRDNSMSEAARAALQKLSSARQFIARWQDYLAAAKSRDARRANEMLRNLATDNADLIPRSEVLALIERTDSEKEARPTLPLEKELEQIAAKAKTLADVAAVLKELRALVSRLEQSQSYSGVNQVHNTVNALTSIETTYRNFQAGLPVSLDAITNQNEQSAVNLTRCASSWFSSFYLAISGCPRT